MLTAAVVVALGAGVTTAAVLVGATDGSGDDVGTQGISLVSYDTCDTALTEMKARLMPHVGPYGFDWNGGRRTDGDVASAEGSGSAEDSGAGAAAPFGEGDAKQAAPAEAPAPGEAPVRDEEQAPDHSTTNNHEAAADEPDLVKTDGARVVTVVDGVLRVVDVKSRKQTALVRLDGGYASQLLLSGDRALVMTSTGIASDMPMPRVAPGEPVPDAGKPTDTFPYESQLVLVDLTGDGEILGKLALDGMYVDARQVGSVARVVLRSAPRLSFGYPRYDGSVAPALLANQEVVEESTIGDWLPRYALTTGGTTSSGQLTNCADVSHPADYTASSMLTVLTFDLGAALGTGDPVTVVADGDTVYGNAANLYIADDHTPHGMDGMRSVGTGRTELYQFSIAGSAKPVHVATGSVPGHLLNQYSLSEFDGHLRVATTVSEQAGTQSMVTVLARKGNTLAEVGSVDGLGVGERIYAVRYFGPTAYVVTFRETDPLYTVDLSDPAAPKVTGELKIPGYSAYLHPAGDGRLIGVGQEADLSGQRLGAQISLFDTSNPAGATRVAQYHLEYAWTAVESDPHAFLYWPAKNLVIMPVTGGGEMGPDGPADQSSGALVLRLNGDSFQQVGLLSHVSDRTGNMPLTPRRAIVIGDELWTISEVGMLVSNLDSLAQLAWLPFS
jgi:hypothetical protein